MAILISFVTRPKEGAIVGRIVAGYGELEYLFSHCLSAALGNRPAIFRAFFRMRGEKQRIDVADALMRSHYEDIGLGSQYCEMIGAMRWCKNVRNQYAHCHWVGFEKEGLFFTNMEEPAKKASGKITFPMHHVDEELLELQEDYCAYTLDWLAFLNEEIKKRRGEIASHDREAPEIISQPILYNLPEKHPYPRTT